VPGETGAEGGSGDCLERAARREGAARTERDRQYGAINQGEIYGIAQGIAGPHDSLVPAFFSRDVNVICKKMGGHPIICKCQLVPCIVG
jgi:hypothetical protein